MSDFTSKRIYEDRGMFRPEGFMFQSKTEQESIDFLKAYSDAPEITLELRRSTVNNFLTKYRLVGDAYYNHTNGKCFKMSDGTFVDAVIHETKSEIELLWEKGVRPTTQYFYSE